MDTAATVEPVQAILQGGPDNIRNETRVQLVSPLEEKIKLPHCGGYEHFERIAAGGIASSDDVIFHWTMRTEIAE